MNYTHTNILSNHRVLFFALDKSDRQLQDSVAWWKLTHIQFVRQRSYIYIGLHSQMSKMVTSCVAYGCTNRMKNVKIYLFIDWGAYRCSYRREPRYTSCSCRHSALLVGWDTCGFMNIDTKYKITICKICTITLYGFWICDIRRLA